MTCKPRTFRVSMKKICAGQVLFSRNVPTSCPSPPILTYLRVRAHLRRYVLDVFLLLPSRSLSLLQKAYSAPMLAVLKHFGYDVENLNGPKVHSLCNVVTMQYDAHDMFDRLHLWFEATVSVTGNMTLCLFYANWPPSFSGSRPLLSC